MIVDKQVKIRHMQSARAKMEEASRLADLARDMLIGIGEVVSVTDQLGTYAHNLWWAAEQVKKELGRLKGEARG